MASCFLPWIITPTEAKSFLYTDPNDKGDKLRNARLASLESVSIHLKAEKLTYLSALHNPLETILSHVCLFILDSNKGIPK